MKKLKLRERIRAWVKRNIIDDDPFDDAEALARVAEIRAEKARGEDHANVRYEQTAQLVAELRAKRRPRCPSDPRDCPVLCRDCQPQSEPLNGVPA